MTRAGLATLLGLTALACEEPFRFPAPVAAVRIAPDSVALTRGTTVQLRAQALDSAGRVVNRPVTWATADARVATISRDGVVTATGDGITTITATVDSVSGSATVMVRVPIGSITIALGDQELVVGGLLRYFAVPRDATGTIITGQTVTWSLSDPTVAQLTLSPPAAVVTGNAPGTTRLTATVGDHQQSVTITVTEVRFTAVWAAASDHACALTPTSAAYCWGNDQVGQLGNGVAAASPAPSRVAGGLSFAVLSAGGRFTCGIAEGNEPYCWGHGASGRLGSGSLDNSAVPIQVASLANLRELASGWSHTCALTPVGDPFCWGNSGALGQDTLKFSTVPVAVSSEEMFRAIVAGDAFSCALAADASAHCWGTNREGQLGSAGISRSERPLPVSGGLAFDTLAAGPSHACALTSAGAMYCWGANHAGQLGDGTTVSSASPVAAGSGLVFTRLSVGSAFTCGITPDGSAYCWGSNQWGQLGAPPSGEKCGGVFCSLAPVAAGSGRRFVALSAGGSHTCGIATDGLAYCWGNNNGGQLGDGTTASSSAPVAVLGQRAAATLLPRPPGAAPEPRR
jgi:alpha-tubulin suppressor-like RCC1 family protein